MIEKFLSVHRRLIISIQIDFDLFMSVNDQIEYLCRHTQTDEKITKKALKRNQPIIALKRLCVFFLLRLLK